MGELLRRIYLAIKEKRLISAIKKRVRGIIFKRLEIKKYKNSPYYNPSYLHEGLKDHVSQINEDFHDQIIKRIINFYKKAKSTEQSVPLAYQLSGEWEKIINVEYATLIDALNNGNVVALKNLLSNFCRSEHSRGLEMGADFMALQKKGAFRSEYIKEVLRQINIWVDLVDDSSSFESLSFPFIGNPFGYVMEGNLIPKCAIRHHYYATRLTNLSINIEKPIICEIGGGFGGMAYYLLKKKEKMFKYIDFDLPEIIVLISYFLMNAFPGKKILLFGERNLSAEAIDFYDIILMPNFELPKLEDKSVDILFNSHSLTEIDEYTVKQYLKQISRICKKYFIHENHDDRNIYDWKIMKRHIQMSKFDLSKTLFRRIHKFPAVFNLGYYEYLYEHYER